MKRLREIVALCYNLSPEEGEELAAGAEEFYSPAIVQEALSIYEEHGVFCLSLEELRQIGVVLRIRKEYKK